MKYDVNFCDLNGKVEFSWLFDSYSSADYFARLECEWEWYEPGHSYVLTITPHAWEETRTFEGEEYKVLTDGKDTLVNLCPHDVTFVIDGAEVVVPASGHLARCKASTVLTGETFMGLPITCTEMGEVTGLPDRYAHVAWVVSRTVRDACPFRPDLFIPNESVRDTSGNIVGCKSLGA